MNTGIKRKYFRRALLSVLVSGCVMAASTVSADVTSLLTKPSPRGTLGEESGRSVARNGNDTLLGAKILGEVRHADSGGAFLFKGDETTPSITYKLPKTVNIRKYSSQGFGEECVISNTDGAELGEHVSMSDKWVAVSTNKLGRQVSNQDYDGTCNEVIPAVFISRRSGSGVLTGHHVSLPSGEQINGVQVSDKDLVIMTNNYTYFYSFNGHVWLYSDRIGLGQGTLIDIYHSALAIEGNYAVAGYPSTFGMLLFEKLDGSWSVVDIIYPRQNSYAKAVSLSEGSIVVASDYNVEFWDIGKDSNGYTEAQYNTDFSTNGTYARTAISGNLAALSDGENLDETVTIFRKNNNTWFKSSDDISQQDVLNAPHPTIPNQTVSYANNNWYVDQLSIDGGIIAAGWRGYNNAPTVERLNGSVVLHDVNAAFGTSHMLDDAESPEPKWLSNGDHLWTRKSGGTSSWGTGPSSGAGGSGYYYYVETSSGYAFQSGDVASLESDYFDPSDVVLSFDLHRYGSDQGLLQIEYQVFGEDVWHWAGWSVSGEEGNHWLSDSHDLRQESAIQAHDKIKVRFKYTASGGYRGDIAIDNIRMSRF